ncbi:MAG: DUF5615 family PIN-like protein [Nitrospira sp.]|nr:DUF5615 family PIN-like protein [Nitrospira sp.]
MLDAQLPRRLAVALQSAGHDSRHALDLPLGNATPDEEIIKIAMSEERIVMTKDRDFVTSFLIHQRPSNILLFSAGSINNVDLRQLIFQNLVALKNAFRQHHL